MSGVKAVGGALYAGGAGVGGAGVSLVTKVGKATHATFSGIGTGVSFVGNLAGRVGNAGLRFAGSHPAALGVVVSTALAFCAFKAYKHFCPPKEKPEAHKLSH